MTSRADELHDRPIGELLKQLANVDPGNYAVKSVLQGLRSPPADPLYKTIQLDRKTRRRGAFGGIEIRLRARV